MLINLILLFLLPYQNNQDRYIGSIERLSPEINKLIKSDAKIEILQRVLDGQKVQYGQQN